MWFQYFRFALLLCLSSWLVGLFLNNVLMRFSWYSRLGDFNFIPSSKVNSMLMVPQFGWIVIHSFFKYLNQEIKWTAGATTLPVMRLAMIKAELGHLIAGLFVIGVSIYAGLTHNWWFCFWGLMCNIPLNLYPVLLQQANKRRIDRLLLVYGKR